MTIEERVELYKSLYKEDNMGSQEPELERSTRKRVHACYYG